MRDYKKSSKK
jgi:DNA excision repair protein ERCC-3